MKEVVAKKEMDDPQRKILDFMKKQYSRKKIILVIINLITSLYIVMNRYNEIGII